jgi:histidinol dehydrogenase
MQKIRFPARKDWPVLLQRPYADNRALLHTVQALMTEVRTTGDAALKKLTQQFDGILLDALQVPEDEIINAALLVPDVLKQAIQQAKANIETFHRAQLLPVRKIETMTGVVCWQQQVPIEKVGLYVPGGTAPLFSTVLMLGVPAQLAGCAEVILCTPCNRNGAVHPAVLFAAALVGIKKIFRLGGAQAVAAMAYGTETVPAVYKILGPGNRYVTAAKQLVQMEGIAIDMPAGPSEVCVLADATADASFVAADLLSQAEHGSDSQVLLIATDENTVDEVERELEQQLAKLPRREMAAKSLRNSRAMVVASIDEAVALANAYAAEHLILNCAQAAEVARKVTTAGSVFIGAYAPESAGDYASGTNHTLPTHAFARAYSGVSMDSFFKKITFQQLTVEGLKNIAPTVITLAEAEGLEAHAEAIRVRLRMTADR